MGRCTVSSHSPIDDQLHQCLLIVAEISTFTFRRKHENDSVSNQALGYQLCFSRSHTLPHVWDEKSRQSPMVEGGGVWKTIRNHTMHPCCGGKGVKDWISHSVNLTRWVSFPLVLPFTLIFHCRAASSVEVRCGILIKPRLALSSICRSIWDGSWLVWDLLHSVCSRTVQCLEH